VANYNGTDGNDQLIGTDEDDIFYSSLGDDTMAGRGGRDKAIIDYSAGGTGESYAQNFGNQNGIYASFRGPQNRVVRIYEIEDIEFLASAASDVFYVDVTQLVPTFRLRFDAGGGTGFDTLNLRLRADSPAFVGNVASGILSAGDMTFLNFEQYTLYLSDNVDDLVLAAGGDRVEAGGGNDRIIGMGGNDFLLGMTGGDTLEGGDGNDRLYANEEYSGLDDGAEIDNLSGGAGDDLVSIGYGDSADGGTGTDRLALSLRGGTIGATLDLSVLFAGGTINVGGGTITGFEAYERIYGTEFSDTIITGNGMIIGGIMAGGIFGFGGDDDITLGSRADTAHGGLGNDVIHGGGDADFLSGDENNDRVYGEAGADTLFGGTGDDEVRGGTENDIIYGNEGNDQLYGEDGADVLDGDSGDDLMSGGAGDDQYLLFGSDTLVEAVGGGNDIARITNLYSFLPGAVFALTAGAEIETLDGSTNSPVAMTLIGNEFAQTIRGNMGDNLIDGGGGADTMIGDAGNDVYIVDNAGDVVTEFAGKGIDEIRTALATYTIFNLPEIENLTGTSGTGQTLTGNAGANIIRGGAGNDMLIGGTGNDSYIVINSGDQISELEGEGQGNDRVFASVDYVLTAGQSVEILSTDNDAGTAALALTGNELANRVIGNAGANILSGGAGDDRIEGGAGNDRLIGGLGRDELFGGSGADTFVFAQAAESRSVVRSDGWKSLPDRISDFVAGEDKIDLSGLDAIRGTGANDSFAFVGAAAFSGQAGQLRVEANANGTMILADLNGDRIADFSLSVNVSSLVASDFIL